MQKLMINVTNLKIAINRSGFTKEQVVASVQDKGWRFSLTGLDRIYRNDLPKNNSEEIIKAIAEKIRCNISDFTESKKNRA